jgi:hypothetical protein
VEEAARTLGLQIRVLRASRLIQSD